MNPIFRTRAPFLHGILLAIATVFLSESCTRHERVPESEEEAVYMLVGEPCSEGDYPTAIARADSILASPREMSDSLKAFIMIDRNVAILEYGHLDWAAEYADSVIDFGERHDMPLAVMQGLQNRGIISRRKGNYEKAISDYKEGLELAVENKDTEMEQVFSDMLAISCAENQLNDEALTFARRSLSLSRNMDDMLGEVNSVSTIGGILVKEGDYEQAIKELEPYHEQASQFRNVLRIKYLTPLLRSYLSLDSLDLVRSTLAETYEALEGMPRNTQAYLVAVNTEAGLAAKEGRYADEWKWLQTADSIGGMGTSPEMWHAERAECLANMGRYADAYAMEKKAFNALDSLRDEQNDTRLAELSVKYDTLSKENEIVRLRAQRLAWGLVALVCVLALTVAISASVASRNRARRRIERLRQEEYLKGLEQERQRMARELHDDIAGSLVGLQWQLRVLSPADSERKVKEIAGRVRRLSHELMPPEFGERGFTEMLLHYVAQFNSSGHGKHIELSDNGSFHWENLAPEDSHELYRMIQGAVNNAIHHGGEGDIKIVLDGDTGFEISVINPLQAQRSAPAADGAGLRSMQSRAAIIGATVAVSEEEGMFILKIKRDL